VSAKRTSIQYESIVNLDAAAPYEGGPRATTKINESWTSNATTARQQTRFIKREINIGAGGTALINLQTDLQQDATAISLVEVRLLTFFVPDTALAGVTVEPDATDGWTGWLQTGSVMNLDIGVQSVPIVNAPDGNYAVTPTNRELLLTNLDGANAVIVTVEYGGVQS
jgi:hypothetical protein